METMISVSKLTKTYDNGENKLYALNGDSFDIKCGAFVAILGASGSGKSTLLNIVSGLEKADSGSIKFGDRDIVGISDKKLTAFRREKVGLIFQAYYLLPSLSVEANIKMGAALSKNNEIAPIIEAVGLEGKEKRLPRQLSGGEQQRVSIARAIAKNPTVLFCDEPTGALDEATGRQILKYLLKLQNEKNLTVIMVTHNPNIAAIATMVIEMNSGKVVRITENINPADVDSTGW
jgi:putative ABC transport system ATP-binding protein